MVPSLSILQTIRLTPNFILYILLPTLIFDAAINLDARELMRNIVPDFPFLGQGDAGVVDAEGKRNGERQRTHGAARRWGLGGVQHAW